MKKITLTVCLIMLMGLTAPMTRAQELPIYFEHIGLEDGLPHTSVYVINQDKHGFMWFGTDNGLAKYDGYHFELYTHDPTNSNSISNNDIAGIELDGHNNMWLATGSSGLNKIDLTTNTVTRYLHDENNSYSISSNSISNDSNNHVLFYDNRYEDQQDYIWFGSDNGLNRLDLKTEQFTRYYHDENDPTTLSNNKIIAIFPDPARKWLWIITKTGLDKFDPTTGKVVRYLPEMRIGTIYILPDGKTMWIGTDDVTKNALYHFDVTAETLTDYPIQGDIRDIAPTDDGKLWIVVNKAGLYLFDPVTGTFNHYEEDQNNPYALNDNLVLNLYQDRDGTLWIGTSLGGVNKVDPQRKQFQLYQHQPDNPNSLSHSDVFGMHVDSEGMIWIGTIGGGLNKFDPNTETFTRYLYDDDDPHSLNHNFVHPILEDSQGQLWIGTWGGGLNRFDSQTEQFIHYRGDTDDPDSLNSNTIRAIVEDAEGNIWIGTNLDGLSKLAPQADTFEHIQHDPNNPDGLISNNIWNIFRDSHDNLWVSTGQGLELFDAESETFIHYHHNENDPNSLSADTVLNIYEDEQGILWLATVQGLTKFDPQNQIFTRYFEHDGLPGNRVQSVLGDAQGMLWISTDKGMARFDPVQETFTNYDVTDGLQGDFFRAWAYAKTANGELYFGGANGLNRFNPADIVPNPVQSPVVLTDFSLFNEAVPIGPDSILKEHINDAESITLAYDQTVFSFEFANLNYTASDKNSYRYMMEGFDDKWLDTTAQRRLATYTNLDPGTYRFRVQAANGDGVQSEHEATLDIIITPPWWETTWFRGLVMMTIIGLIAGAFVFQRQTAIRREHQLEYQVAERTRDLAKANQQLTREINARTEIQRDLLLLDMAVTQTAEGIAIADMDGYNQFINKAWAEMHGYTKEELQGAHLSLFHTEEQFQEEVKPIIEQVMKTGHYEGEDTHVKKDGTCFYTWMSVNLVRDNEGQPIAIVGACRDITMRRKAQKALQQAKEAAETANKAKSTFLSSMSHELRTPLNGILGYAQILKQKRDLDTDQQEGLDIIYNSGHHLLTLINDVLDLAKIESGKMELYTSETSLHKFLDSVVGVMRMAAHQKDIRFMYEADPNLPHSVDVDEKRLRQVLLNLLGNAVKFTAQGGVSFKVRSSYVPEWVLKVLSEQTDHLQYPSGHVGVCFDVSDTGAGMTPEQLESIFKPFEQVGDVKKRAEGTGLGLAISQQLVNLMGGDIQVKSEFGKGSTFWFEITLPIVSNEANETIAMQLKAETRGVIGYEGDRRKVLIVDDHPENRMVLLNMLGALGFEIVLAEDGEEGLAKAKADRPDFILTDLVMPVMSGFEMVQKIRESPEFQDVPIVAVSANVFEMNKEKSLSIGCQAFLSKPVEADKLFALIAEHLGLEWIYEETADIIETDVISTKAELIPPPQEELEKLYELTMFGDLQKVSDHVGALAQKNSDYLPFAQTVQQHVQKIEDEPILELLDSLSDKYFQPVIFLQV
ncbi:two-component regulator propeller domain-containing protein [Anaerolineales bacterium HSG25]|nr:two-component regulator propeller domain-containing protein [Anaerolineales bacterium HSG25]